MRDEPLFLSIIPLFVCFLRFRYTASGRRMQYQSNLGIVSSVTCLNEPGYERGFGTMIERIRKYARRHWREFSKGKAGKRFQDRYHRRQKHGHGPLGIRRLLNLTLGIVIVAASAVGGLLPALGWGTAIIGFALIAGEVLPAARLLDWAEIRLRRFWQVVRDIWNHSWAGKVLISLVALLLVAAFAYLTYSLLFGR